ncbi:hypothetical protein V6N12_058241 [Hibiscus sabdariffa]|uniref:Ribosomal protein S4 n=1 Tax=Hibiscus sabdariffa TaxID=183260 RepID=A0ABR2ERN2_9ROSI
MLMHSISSAIDAKELAVYLKEMRYPYKTSLKLNCSIKNSEYGLGSSWTKCLLDLNELEEIRTSAYDNAKIYKEKTKRWHNKRILPRHYQPRQQVLLFNSRHKFFPGKLKYRWSGPFEITQVAPHGAITIRSLKGGHEFKVNGQILKPYMGAHTERDKGVVTFRDA